MRLAMASIPMLGLLSVSVTRAEAPTGVQIEVNFLLAYVEGSGCEFFRNGTWHDSKTAQGHLRDKYNYLRRNFNRMSPNMARVLGIRAPL